MYSQNDSPITIKKCLVMAISEFSITPLLPQPTFAYPVTRACAHTWQARIGLIILSFAPTGLHFFLYYLRQLKNILVLALFLTHCRGLIPCFRMSLQRLHCLPADDQESPHLQIWPHNIFLHLHLSIVLLSINMCPVILLCCPVYEDTASANSFHGV